LPPNPMELLASARMDQILLEASQEVDVIIVDSPPSVVADFQVLATKLDGVLMVVQPGHTRADAAFAMLEQLQRVDGSVLGVVLNKIPHGSYYYGGYYHYYDSNKSGQYYYRHTEENQPQLVENEEAVKLLPRPEQPQPVGYFVAEQHQVPEGLDNVFQPRMPVEVYAPPSQPPASLEIITKPRKKKSELRMLEAPTYVIQKHQLEYWYDDEESGR